MPYCQLFYHLVWSTKNREPLITEELEPMVYALIRSKATDLGAMVYALGGVADHVHLVATIPPSIAVARLVGQVKAVASTRINKARLQEMPFFWQAEYGALTFDARRLPNYVAYVRNQKQHHAENTVFAVLERHQAPDQHAMCEDGPEYETLQDDWADLSAAGAPAW